MIHIVNVHVDVLWESPEMEARTPEKPIDVRDVTVIAEDGFLSLGMIGCGPVEKFTNERGHKPQKEHVSEGECGKPCTILHPQPHFFHQCTQSTCALQLCPWHSLQMHQRSRWLKKSLKT